MPKFSTFKHMLLKGLLLEGTLLVPVTTSVSVFVTVCHLIRRLKPYLVTLPTLLFPSLPCPNTSQVLAIFFVASSWNLTATEPAHQYKLRYEVPRK